MFCFVFFNVDHMIGNNYLTYSHFIDDLFFELNVVLPTDEFYSNLIITKLILRFYCEVFSFFFLAH